MKAHKITHEVIDTIYHEDEGQGIFTGSFEQCYDFISTQDTYGLEIRELTREEVEFLNSPQNFKP